MRRAARVFKTDPMTDRVFDVDDLSATARLAAVLAASARPGDLLALWGDLGSGKTALARALIRARTGDPDEEVPSPTFTLLQVYDGADGVPVFHYDLYRLERPEDVWELDLEDALASGVTLIEWPERLGSLLPVDRLDVRLEEVAGDPSGPARQITLSPRGAWTSRMKEIDDHAAG